MNRIRTVTLGATVLTALALATSAAAPPPARATPVDLLLPLLFQTSTKTNYAVFDDDLKNVGTFPIDEAKRKTGWVHVDALSAPTHVVFADGSCLTNVADGAGQRAAKRACTSGSAANQMWTVGASSLSIAKPIVARSPVVSYAFANEAGLTLRATGAEYTTYVGAGNITGPLRARVTSVDSARRTAVMGGSARPNSTLLVDDDATRRVPVASNGAWSYTATGLAAGVNHLVFDEYSGPVKSASITVDVTTDAGTAFGVTAPRSGDRFAPGDVVFEGTGEPGAQVTIAVTSFSAAPATGSVDDTGHWRITRYLGDGPYVFSATEKGSAGDHVVTGIALSPR